MKVLCREVLGPLLPADRHAALPAALIDFQDAEEMLSEDRRFSAAPRDARCGV